LRQQTTSKWEINFLNGSSSLISVSM